MFKELFLGVDLSESTDSSANNKNSGDLPRQNSAATLRQTANSHFRRQSHGHPIAAGVKLVHRFMHDTAILLDHEEVNSSLSSLSDNMSSLSDIASSLGDNVGSGGIQEDVLRRRLLNHPAFTCVQSQQCEDVYADFSPASKVGL